MLELIYDSRELKLKELFNDSKPDYIELKESYLDLGDIIFKHNNNEILIIERKTLSDLYSSIQDGRYKEQKIRLMSQYNREQIVYLIEGDVNNNIQFFKKSKSITDGALLNMAFRDKITIIRTKNINETCSILYLLGKKIINNPEYFESNNNNNNNNNSLTYLDTIKVCKKDNMTPKLCNIVQLSQIPGVSKQMAQTIIEKYGSISNLIYEYQQIDIKNINIVKDKMELLKDIKLSNRKLGPILSKRIFEYLFY